MGKIYTPNADGLLISLISASGIITNNNSFYQAKADSQAITGEADGSRKVQVLAPRSRIILKLPADLTVGDDVSVASSTNSVVADKVKLFTSGGVKLGKIFEIISGNKKSVDDEVGFVEVSF